LNDRIDNPYASPRTSPERKPRPLKVYLIASWAGIRAACLTFAIACGLLVVSLNMLWPDSAAPGVFTPQMEFWRLVAAAGCPALGLLAGAWGFVAKLREPHQPPTERIKKTRREGSLNER
jgi:hypothetical protein